MNKANNYRFYATLFDEYQWYLRNESEDAAKSFIDKINRVPITDEKALQRMDKGKALNDLLDNILWADTSIELEPVVMYNGFEFDKVLILNLANRLYGSSQQYRTSTTVQTKYGEVEIYGVVDYLCFWKIVDLKGTSSYDLGKYNNHFQRYVYNICIADEGLDFKEFEFLVTDYKNVFSETYKLDYNESKNIVVDAAEGMIEFLEANRQLITDEKIFAPIVKDLSF